MERLQFGTRARRKAARRASMRRFGILVWIAGLVFGIPGANAGIDLISELTTPGGRLPDPATLQAGLVEGPDGAASALEFRHRVFDARPVPSPSPTAAEQAQPAAPAGTVPEIIYAAAAEFGLSGDYLLGVARCESSLNPNATSPAGYYGLFQFDQQTWAAYGYGSIYDPAAQARTAARLLAAGQSSRWPNCA